MKKYTLFWISILCLILVGIPSHTAASFPTGHPGNAFSSTFAWFNDQFNIYVWRENYSVWIEIEPIEPDEPFICSPSFIIIQNDVQFDTVELLPVSGNSQCVYIGPWIHRSGIDLFRGHIVRRPCIRKILRAYGTCQTEVEDF